MNAYYTYLGIHVHTGIYNRYIICNICIYTYIYIFTEVTKKVPDPGFRPIPLGFRQDPEEYVGKDRRWSQDLGTRARDSLERSAFLFAELTPD